METKSAESAEKVPIQNNKKKYYCEKCDYSTSFESLEKTYFHKKTCFQTFPKCFKNGNTKSAEKYYKEILLSKL